MKALPKTASFSDSWLSGAQSQPPDDAIKRPASESEPSKTTSTRFAPGATTAAAGMGKT